MPTGEKKNCKLNMCLQVKVTRGPRPPVKGNPLVKGWGKIGPSLGEKAEAKLKKQLDHCGTAGPKLMRNFQKRIDNALRHALSQFRFEVASHQLAGTWFTKNEAEVHKKRAKAISAQEAKKGCKDNSLLALLASVKID